MLDNQTTLTDLPDELIIDRIVPKLSTYGVCTLAGTCRTLKRLLYNLARKLALQVELAERFAKAAHQTQPLNTQLL